MRSVSNAVIQFLSSSKARMTILGLLVLTTGVLTTVYLVGQQQDIRQRASTWSPSEPLPPNCTIDYQTEENVSHDPCQPGEYYCVDMGLNRFKRATCTSAGSVGSESPPSTCSCTYAGSTYYDCSVCQSIQSGGGEIPGGGQNPPLGGQEISAPNCASCTPEKPYACPGFMGSTTCSRSSLFGICKKCEIPQATSTPTPSPTVTPTPTTGSGTPTPIITPPVFCNTSYYIYSCGTSPGSGNILRRPATSPDSAVFWQCQSTCIQTTSGCFTCGSQPQSSPTPTTNPECAASTGKSNGCVCAINAHCTSGFCELTSLQQGVCADPDPGGGELTCDPNTDDVINLLDFQWWRDEFTGVKTTKVADCFSPNDAVDLQDFQIWREIFITHERQPF